MCEKPVPSDGWRCDKAELTADSGEAFVCAIVP